MKLNTTEKKDNSISLKSVHLVIVTIIAAATLSTMVFGWVKDSAVKESMINQNTTEIQGIKSDVKDIKKQIRSIETTQTEIKTILKTVFKEKLSKIHNLDKKTTMKLADLTELSASLETLTQ